MQIHGCGLFNIKELFGIDSYLASIPMQLIIEFSPAIQYEADPLEAARSQQNILGIELPKLTIPLPSPRNLPLVTELLVRKEITKK